MKRQSNLLSSHGIRSALVVMLLAAAASFLGIRSQRPPKALSESASASEFSAARAAKYLDGIAQEPHPLGTLAHNRVRDFLTQTLRGLGYDTQIQSSFYGDPDLQVAARVENIVTRLPGIRPSGKALMLCAHYDSAGSSFGAGDDGAGLVAILEAARALKSGSWPLKQDLIFLLTDGEEDGTLGARAFVRENPWAKDIGLVLNFDPRGTRGAALMFKTSPGDSGLVRELVHAASFPWANSLSTTIYRRFVDMSLLSDISVFMAAGMQGMSFAFAEGWLDRHSPQDRIPNLDLHSLQHLGTYALALARHFGENGVPERSRTDDVYFNLAGFSVVRYSSETAMGLAVLIVALGVVAGLVGFKKKILTAKGLFASIPILLLQLSLTVAFAFLFRKAPAASHGSWLHSGPFQANPLYLLSLVFLALMISLLIFGYSKISWEHMAYTAGLLLTILALVLTIALPGASYIAAWPGGLLLFSVLIAFIVQRKGSTQGPGRAISGLSSIPSALFMAPIIYLFFVAFFFTVPSTISLAGLVALFLWTLIPVLNLIGRRYKGVGILAVATLFLASSVAGALTTRFTARHPSADSIDFWLDMDSQTASWVVMARMPNAWIAAALPQAEQGHPMDTSPYRSPQFLHQPAPFISLAPPVVEKKDDVVGGGIRTLTLHVASPRLAREILVHGGTSQVISAEIEGKKVMEAKENQNRLMLWLPGPPLDGYTLVLKVKVGTPVSLMVRELLPWIPDEAQKHLPESPPWMSLDKSMTIRKTYEF